MTADLLDDILMEMTSISHERSSDVESVFDTSVGLEVEAEEGTLLEFHPAVLGGMDVLHPAVVVRGRALIDVLLENNDIGIGDTLCIHRG
jgi:hypothetical protein